MKSLATSLINIIIHSTMRKPESYWNSDDEDEGPRTYRNVRPSAVGIERGGGHNHASAMHRDYVKSRQAMTQIDEAMEHRVKLIKAYKKDLREWNPDHGDISDLISEHIEEAESQLLDLRRLWSFHANNYHRYDDVGARTQNAYNAYITHHYNQLTH